MKSILEEDWLDAGLFRWHVLCLYDTLNGEYFLHRTNGMAAINFTLDHGYYFYSKQGVLF